MLVEALLLQLVLIIMSVIVATRITVNTDISLTSILTMCMRVNIITNCSIAKLVTVQ